MHGQSTFDRRCESSLKQLDCSGFRPNLAEKKHKFVPLFTKLLYYSQFINSKYILHVTVYTLACCGHTFVPSLYVYVLQSVALGRHAAFLYLRKEMLINNVADGVRCEDF